MTVTAFVPARSGSKRLPNKNVRELAGKPLILWTLEACMNSAHIDKVILSTDSKDYWALARNHFNSPRLLLDYRSEEEAGDKVKILDYLKTCTDKIFGNQGGQFLMALPTMPLRTTKHVCEAIKLSKKLGRGVFSASEYDFAISFAFTSEGVTDWRPIFDNSPMLTGNTRSQDQIRAYHPNGAIYIRNIDDLRKKELKTLYQDCAPYIMDKSVSVDIDTTEDFKLAEALMSKA